MTTKISLYTPKGGVGKTTATISLAGELAQRGYKVLLIDCDKSCNLSSSLELLSAPKKYYPEVIYEALEEQVPPDCRQSIVPSAFENLFVMPNNEKLANRCMPSLAQSNQIYRKVFGLIEKNFDFIFLDSPGDDLSPIHKNLLAYVDDVVIPVCPDKYGTDSFTRTFNIVIGQIKPFDNPNINVIGAFLNLYKAQRGQDKDVLESIGGAIGDYFIPVVLKDLQIYRSATNEKKPLCVYAPNNEQTKQVSLLADEILKRISIKKEV